MICAQKYEGGGIEVKETSRAKFISRFKDLLGAFLSKICPSVWAAVTKASSLTSKHFFEHHNFPFEDRWEGKPRVRYLVV
jgi:hypothetical protein